MNYLEKRQWLERYILCLARLERKCEEADRWASLAEGGEVDSSNQIKTTSLQIRSECEELAFQVQQLRAELVAAFGCIQGDRQREVMELYYLSGYSTGEIEKLKGWSSRYVRRVRSEAIASLEKYSDCLKK